MTNEAVAARCAHAFTIASPPNETANIYSVSIEIQTD